MRNNAHLREQCQRPRKSQRLPPEDCRDTITKHTIITIVFYQTTRQMKSKEPCSEEHGSYVFTFLDAVLQDQLARKGLRFANQAEIFKFDLMATVFHGREEFRQQAIEMNRAN